MIASQIREHCGVEAQRVRAVECDRMRRHFHHGGAATGRHRPREHSLNVGSFGRRVPRVGCFAAYSVTDGSKHSGRAFACSNDRVDQVCGRGLAIGAGDTRQFHLPGRMTVHRRCRASKRTARVSDLNPRRRFGELGLTLGDYAYRATADGLSDVPMGIHFRALDRDEDRARLARARVVSYITRFGIQPPAGSNHFDFFCQIGQLQFSPVLR